MPISIALALALAAAPAGRSSHAAPLTFCTAARVGGPDAAPVFSTMTGQRRPLARLAAGEAVYACETRGDWVRIYYGAPGPCGAATAGGLDGRKTLSCRSGWVRRSGLDLLPD